MHSLGVFLSKLTGITAKSNGMVVSVKALAFDGILRGRRLLVVFYGSRDLSMLHNQFSQDFSQEKASQTKIRTNCLIHTSVC